VVLVGVSLTYPINQKPTISDVTVRVSLSSRVACVGPNGAGKSTMIKCLRPSSVSEERANQRKKALVRRYQKV
jgi:elongation factor 3